MHRTFFVSQGKIVVWFVFTLFWAALLFASVELLSRHLFENHLVSRKPAEIVYDDKVGWIGRPGYVADTTHGKYPVSINVAINGDGFRDDDWDEKLDEARRNRVTKILVLGDSYVYGFASQKDERLTEQLDTVYRLAGRPVKIFNAGIPAFGTSQEFRLLPQLLARIRPDIVLLLFTENDYGDTALPYDHRHPYRIYKPFYDIDGQLALNALVPKRPSSLFDGTIIEKFRSKYALDELHYFFEDFVYSKHGIPNRRNAPFPIAYYDFFIFEEWLHSRFPYVEDTVFALLARMQHATEAAGGTFYVISSSERYEYVVKDKMHSKGIEFVPVPSKQAYFQRWQPVLYDGHPNFVWAWIMANHLFTRLEGRSARFGWKMLPQFERVPADLLLADDSGSARFIFGDWGQAVADGRWLGTAGAVLLRSEAAVATPTLVEVTAVADGFQTIVIRDQRNVVLCRLTFTTVMESKLCETGPSEQGLLFLEALVEAAMGEAAMDAGETGLAEGDSARLLIHRIAVK